MARLPKITLQGWTADGPAYTIHHELSGFRNRKLRRAGEGGEEKVGDHDAARRGDVGGPAAYMLYARGDVEVYAFKGGYVYQVTLLVDGEPIDVLVDARPGDRIETIADDMQLLEQRALEGDELERALEQGPEQTESVSDGAESQEPHPGHRGEEELTDAQVDELDTRLDEEAEARSDNRDGQVTALTGAQVEAPPVQAVPEAPAPEDAPIGETPTDEAKPAEAPDGRADSADDDDDSSTGPHNYDGTVAEFAELVEAMEEEELKAFREQDTRKGVREAADHELMRRADEASPAGDDTAGGNGEPASGEEE